MRAVVCYGNNKVKYEEVPNPICKPNEVIIKVMSCGICGSDIPRAVGTSAHSYPIILGHEFSGIINEVGCDVADFNIGDKVCVAPLIPCGSCEQCRLGNYSLCEKYSFIGSRQQGGMAEYISVPASNVIKLADNVSFEQGALFEPATVGLHALYINNHKKDGYTAILGGGTIGIFTMQWAKIIGSKKIVVFGRDKKHLELSKDLGADEVISTLDEDFMQRTLEITDGHGFDNVYETAGSTKTIKYAFELGAKKSHICMVGTPTKELTFSVKEWEQINRKEFLLTGSWMSYSSEFPGKEWKITQECFSNGSLKYDDRIFYKKFPMYDAQKAFSLFKENRENVKGRVLFIKDKD